jgi:hypothetical protein
MVEPSLSDLVLKISVERNLDSTVETFKAMDIPVWEKLLITDPVGFFNLAFHGYTIRQKKKGQREVKREELNDFQRQFIAKFYYVTWRDKAAIPAPYLSKLMFELD